MNNDELIAEYEERLTSNSMPIIYNLRHLRILLGITKSKQSEFFGNERDKKYYSFEIPKKSGGTRIIEVPDEKLMAYQKWIKNSILDKMQCSEYAKGFKKGNSIVDNAAPHVGNEVVINLDIENFFPSIRYSQVFRMFYYYGYNRQVAHLLARLCTNRNNIVPQGAPTSPDISNIVLLKLDKRMGNLAKANYCNYTRYADDITFSGDKRIIKLLPLIKKIIQEEGYKVNEKKVRVQYNYQRQEVTGLIVNKRISVSKTTLKELEQAVYYCSKYGVEEHMKRIGCEKAFYKEHLYGIAYFVKMVDEERGKKYLSELDRIVWPY